MPVTEDNRSKIMQAGLTLFGIKGYSDTTTREIASLSGLSEGTVFNHFKDKPSLYQETVEVYNNQPLQELEAVDKKLGYHDLADDLYQLSTTYMEAMFSHFHILRVVMQDKTSAYPQLPDRKLYALIKLTDHFKAYLAQAADKGLVPTREYDVEANLFICHLFRFVQHTASHEKVFTPTAKIKNTLFKKAKEMSPRIARDLFAQ